ncbi:MAG TPA: phytanoyl-CoA dioxygenase family protein [Phenylobacterium sp.]|jgi:hypothetical protein
MAIDWAAAHEAYRRDGAVRVPGLLNGEQLDAALKAWEWSLANPTPANAPRLRRDGTPLFYADSYSANVMDGYRAMLEASPIPEACARLWGTDPVWFIYEQVFLKEGGDTRRTPWHQDGSYIPIDGDDVAVAWITFEPLCKDDSLEFVPGSHLGPMYNTSKFDPKDDTIPHDETLPYPRLPPIEAEREKWPTISWAVEPGDVIFFHFRTLHGGAPTRQGQRRRTLTLRFFGEHAHYDPKTAKALPNAPDMATRLGPGDLMRAPGFLQLYPKAGTPEGVLVGAGSRPTQS